LGIIGARAIVKGFRIGVVAPGGRIAPEVAEQVLALAASVYPTEALQIHFHPQCFMSSGHFAGDDETRAAAFAEVGNDPSIDAVWFARGGYGACRMAEAGIARLGAVAAEKTYLGYSDTGALLGALYKAGIGRPAHGPMPGDIVREGGEGAVLRALSYLTQQDAAALEPSIDPATPSLAYNIAVLSSVLGTPLEPPLAGHVLNLEEVGEYMYRLDRYLFHVTSSAAIREVAGIRLGRVSATLANTPEFGEAEEQVIDHWCTRSGIPYLGRAEIGHDVDNMIVPFGR
jgi:muramoyltetrapeptide carboxypeptidase